MHVAWNGLNKSCFWRFLCSCRRLLLCKICSIFLNISIFSHVHYFIYNNLYYSCFIHYVWISEYFKDVFKILANLFWKKNFIHIETHVQRCSAKKGVLTGFAKFTVKHQCQRDLILNFEVIVNFKFFEI